MRIFFMSIFIACIFFISSATVHAEFVNISDDNLETFMTKCNSILKTGDSNSFLDTPTFLNTESEVLNNYVDKTLKTENNIPITITYTLKDNKVYAIMLEADKFDENVKTYYEGLSIIFLKSLGMTDTEAKSLLNDKNETSWQREGFISRMNKKYIVSFYSPTLLIIAENN